MTPNNTNIDFSPITDIATEPLTWILVGLFLFICYGVAIWYTNTAKNERALYLDILKTYAGELISIFRRKK